MLDKYSKEIVQDIMDLTAADEGNAIARLRKLAQDRPRVRKGVRVNYFSNVPKIVKGKKMAGRKPVDKNESPADKFERLSLARLNKAVNVIDLIGQLTGSQYERLPAQVDVIENVLLESVAAAVAALRLGKGSKKVIDFYALAAKPEVEETD